jgi:alpha-D-xyloside xylohydrolase
MHNLYPLLYNRAVYQAFQELGQPAVLWARSAWAGSQRYPVHWSGDPKCNWRDLKHVLIGGLNLSLSGFAYWSHDIGGFVGEGNHGMFELGFGTGWVIRVGHQGQDNPAQDG